MQVEAIHKYLNALLLIINETIIPNSPFTRAQCKQLMVYVSLKYIYIYFFVKTSKFNP